MNSLSNSLLLIITSYRTKCTEGDVGTGKFTCGCTQHWTGRLCAQDVDDCAKGLCQNSAKCTEGAVR